MTDDYDHITDDIEAIVRDYNLPESLRHRIYETIEDREGVTLEQADEIAQAISSRYEDSRVDAHDPVGTVSAQSIGEPGTQMSIPADEEIIVRRDGETDVVESGLSLTICFQGERRDVSTTTRSHSLPTVSRFQASDPTSRSDGSPSRRSAGTRHPTSCSGSN